MTVLINDNPVNLPNDYMTIADLVKWKEIPSQGTAIAINNKLIKQENWKITNLKDQDRITIISASYGG